MKLASAKGASPQDYIKQMNLRNPITPRVYRCILNGFNRFAAERTKDNSISQETIRQWLNDRILVWPLHLVTHRARLVERFLDWRVRTGALESNPFADLKAKYGQRSTTPVVRALLNPDFGPALEAREEGRWNAAWAERYGKRDGERPAYGDVIRFLED